MSEQNIHGPRCQLLVNSLKTDINYAKIKASAVVTKLNAMTQNKVTRARAANIISLLYDAEQQLETIQEEMGWK